MLWYDPVLFLVVVAMGPVLGLAELSLSRSLK